MRVPRIAGLVLLAILLAAAFRAWIHPDMLLEFANQVLCL